MATQRKKWVDWLVIGFCAYFVTALAVYRFRNPELTETQLFLRLPNALLWID